MPLDYFSLKSVSSPSKRSVQAVFPVKFKEFWMRSTKLSL